MGKKAKPETLNAMRVWMRVASVEEQEELAALAGTTRKNLYQLAIDNRSASSRLASRLEKAAAALRKINKRLPELLRTDLNDACRDCEFARRCLGADKVTRSEFDYIPEGEQNTKG